MCGEHNGGSTGGCLIPETQGRGQSRGSLLSCTVQPLPGEAKCLLVSRRPWSPWLVSLAPRQTGEIQVLPVPLLGLL